MKCPVCSVELNIYHRQGIEVDYCPQCRGVWLDRGELDKIIEATLAEAPPVARAPMPQAQVPPPTQPQVPTTPRHFDDDRRYKRDDQRGDYRPHHRDDDDDDDHYKYNKRRKKRGVLGEIFDIFD
jgi:Zn-finger nucleic acid-binding protein